MDKKPTWEKGYGKQMILLLIKYIKENINYTSIFLTVFHL